MRVSKPMAPPLEGCYPPDATCPVGEGEDAAWRSRAAAPGKAGEAGARSALRYSDAGLGASQQLLARLRQASERSETLRHEAARLSQELRVSTGRAAVGANSVTAVQKRPLREEKGAAGGDTMFVLRAPQKMRIRVRIGTLDFHTGSGFGLPALFETSGLRVFLQLGQETPARWIQGGPATQKQQALKFSRCISRDGQYSTRANCEFDEEIDLPWPAEQPPQQLSADVWLERRSVAEKLDAILDQVGLGNDLPEYDRTWLGRVACSLPIEGQDTIPQNWPVTANANVNGPMPKSLTVGFEWVVDDADDECSSALQECRAALDVKICDKEENSCTGSYCMTAPICALWGHTGIWC